MEPAERQPTAAAEYEAAYEVAAANLDQLIAWAATHLDERSHNEATTRLQLIDRLFFECLGWNREQAVAEDRFERTYADYILGTRIRLLVEAKREGTYFELPAGFDRRTIGLPKLVKDEPAIGEAVQQALGYCQERGIPLGAVCNGTQLVVFIASRGDSIPPSEGRGLIVSSLEELREDFRFFWDRLSKIGVESYRLYTELQGETLAPPPEKLSSRLSDYPGFKNRNTLATELRNLGELFLEDITREPSLEDEFVGATYCPSGALSQYALVSREILQTRYSSLFAQESEVSAEPVQTKHGITPALGDDIVAAAMSRRPIVLLGDVGVGKSMFIRHFIAVDARDVVERSIMFYVDFGAAPAVAGDIGHHVATSIVRQLDDKYGVDIHERSFVRGVYHGDILKFEKSIYGDLRDEDALTFRKKQIELLEAKVNDVENHLRQSLEHISKGRGQQIIIFLDNVDQRPDEFQEGAFLTAQAMADQWPGTVFVSLRPETFNRSRRGGSLSAYQLRVFTIAPPRVDDVIRKRLQYALDQLVRTGRLPSFVEGFTLESTSLKHYLKALIHSLDANERLIELIDNLSGGNVRRALEFIRSFVGSGHVDAEKIVNAMEETGRYLVPIHEFLRAILYVDHAHFDPDASHLANLFDLTTPDEREHFLVPLLLRQIQRAGDVAGDEGFVGQEDIHSFATGLGFAPAQIMAGLDRMLRKELIEVSPRSINGRDPYYRITSIGAYSVTRLIRMFTYMDAIVEDTPIAEPKFDQEITSVTTLEQRLARADAFRRYLDLAWVAFEDLATPFEWPDASRDLDRDIQGIARRYAERRQQDRQHSFGF